jgi:hypothetical protein
LGLAASALQPDHDANEAGGQQGIHHQGAHLADQHPAFLSHARQCMLELGSPLPFCIEVFLVLVVLDG